MASSSRQPCPPLDAFAIAWITAITIELTAAEAMLDIEYEDRDDTVPYKLGRVGRHNIVICTLPAGQIGTVSATGEVVRLRQKFPCLKYALLVGVGGGVPSTAVDIRLGDIVISRPEGLYSGAVQYDLGKTGPNGIERTGTLNAPPRELLSAVSRLVSDQDADKAGLETHLGRFKNRPKFSRPQELGSDALFNASYAHSSGSDCSQCDPKMIIPRPLREYQIPRIYCGIIASGNQVIKDGITRDRISRELGNVLCFEMEAAGIMNYLPSLIVRGVCDYSDSHKSKRWQPFAAAAAAAAAKEILQFVPSEIHPKINDRISQLDDSKHPQASKMETRKYVLSDLRFDQIDDRFENINTVHEQTCRWFLKRPEYQNWISCTNWANMTKNDHGLLWIKGKPGTGKSSLMKFAYSNAKSSYHEVVCISFFFNARGEELEKSSLGMLRSLLTQILTKFPSLQSIITTLNSEIDTPYFQDIETMKVLFRRAVLRAKDGLIACFIDALDECEEDDVRDMIRFLEDIIRSTSSRFRVCFSSRHYPHISIGHSTEIVLEDQEEHNQDIEKYLDKELRTEHSPLIDAVKAEIKRKSSGLFLWVVLVVRILQKEYDHGRIDAMEKKICEIPSGLFELFHGILTRDQEDVEYHLLCLQWVLFAKRPLGFVELYFALISGIDAQNLTPWNPGWMSLRDIERRLLSISKGLIELTKSRRTRCPTVQFIHEAVRDYLLKEDMIHTMFMHQGGRYSIGASHELLKGCCQKYLEMAQSSIALPEELPKGISITPISLRRTISEKFPFLEYALRNILYHANAASADGISQVCFLKELQSSDWFKWEDVFKTDWELRHDFRDSFTYVVATKNLRSLTKSFLYGVQHEIPNEGLSQCPLYWWTTTSNSHTSDALIDYMSKNRTDGMIHKYCSTKNLPLRPFSQAFSGSNFDTENMFCLAIRDDDVALVDILYQERLSLQKATKVKAQTRLTWAVETGCAQLVKFFIAKGDDIIEKDRAGQMPIEVALRKNQPEIANILLQYHSDNSDYPIIYRALLLAAEHGHDESVWKVLCILEALYPNGCILDSRCLLLAIKNSHRMTVWNLLRQTAKFKLDVSFKYPCQAPDSPCNSPLLEAIRVGDSFIVRILLDDSNIDIHWGCYGCVSHPLIEAIRRGDRTTIRLLLRKDNLFSRPDEEAIISQLLQIDFRLIHITNYCISNKLHRDAIDHYRIIWNLDQKLRVYL